MTSLKDVLKGIEAFVLTYVEENLAFEKGKGRKKLEEIRRGLKHSEKVLMTDFNKIYLQFYKRNVPYKRGISPRYSHPRRLIAHKKTLEIEEI